MEKNENLSRSFYKWHRILGLIALVPIICWTLSGLSHPFMSNWFRPFIPEEHYEQPTQNQLQPTLSLQQVLNQNHITQFRNFGLVSFNKQTYYQILQQDSSYNYYLATDAKLLPNADRDYAIYLARYFTQDSVSKVKSVTLQKQFDGQYQPINHLLPVWKVSFDRADGMDIYVETGQSRLATFNNTTRKVLLSVFEQMHTWDFMAALFGDQFRLIVMLCVVTILFLSLISGLVIYGFFWKRFKEIAQKRKAKGIEDKRWLHRYHRQLGLFVSVLMLMFFTSAGFHILVKLHNVNPIEKQYAQLIKTDGLKAGNLHLPMADSLILKQAIVKIMDDTYYQVTDIKKNIHYFNTAHGTELLGGDQVYATYLANFYRPQTKNEAPTVNPIKQFTNEYGFINKRLPVQQVSYHGNDNWYVETTTGKLAAHVAGIDRVEGLAFIFLHKFFWMTWAGKDIRDVVSMLAALSILTVALLGFMAFIKNK
ncbi:PepSY-associated TM helix domain-containing protein [Mucilaginibacter boryungensis]|uniref:PepSY domain-containing protein n=1 Tax=Mucilaginibacter boryungensis TaxID=768480 RepID=A0ABR9XH00_9SPHI|nr:PepSY-associated TM helix domain-containing protein [Mucilaginibacter boryungensis]MBE9666283.1 PepSY domain-containing protein [Mucilaginibacter boryungensis]